MFGKPLPQPIVTLINKHLLKVEILLVIIVITGYVIKLLSIDYGSVIFNIGFILLPILYFLAGFTFIDTSKLLLVIASRVIFISYSVLLVGLYFNFNAYPGAEDMINIGSISLLVALVLYVISSIKNWQQKDMVILLRSLILLTLVVMVSM